MERYEYKLIQLSPIFVGPNKLELSLNLLASEGWYVLHFTPDFILLERPVNLEYEQQQQTES